MSPHLATRLRHTIHGPMWHGPSLVEALGDLSAADAARRPVAGAHAPWELVQHVALWAEIALARLEGRPDPDPAPEVDFPPPPARPTNAEWHAARRRMIDAYERLAAHVDRMDGAILTQSVRGKPYDVATMLDGVIEHGCYHGGQLMLLRRALESRGR